MIRRSNIRTTAAASIAACALPLLAACAGERVPPASLTNARAELARAKSSSAMQLAPAEVHDAELALQRAEQAYADDPGSASTDDLAVVAELRVKKAEVDSAAMQAQARKEQATRDLQALQAQTQAQELTHAEGELNKTRAQLEQERQQRADAERKLRDAQDTLSKIANVKDDDRGLVITFQGDVLFKTGQSTLLPQAMAKLDQVAEQLRGQERKIVVYGHTDNQGGAGSYNQTLSEKRAGAVRDYLVSKGIPQDLVSSEGKGPSMPVADNNSVEGRAANRRVEIIVQPKK